MKDGAVTAGVMRLVDWAAAAAAVVPRGWNEVARLDGPRWTGKVLVSVCGRAVCGRDGRHDGVAAADRPRPGTESPP